MDYLLDSDIIIDFLKKKQPGYSLLKNLSYEKIAISIISWIEILYGIKKSSDPKRRFAEFEDFLTTLEISIIPLDKKVAEAFAEVKIATENQKQPLADFDLFIAATALSYNLTLLTRNIKHFNRIDKIKFYK